MSKVYIAGTGDLAREVLHAILEHNRSGGEIHEVQGFLDPVHSPKETIESLPVLRMDSLDGNMAEGMRCVIGIGRPEFVRKAAGILADKGIRQWISVVHPRAYVAAHVQLGKGVYIAAHATIAIAAKLHDFSVINQNVSIGHDAVIGRYSIVNPGCVVSGRCHLEEGVYLGSAAVLFPGVRVGSGSMISANCVITKDVPEGVKVMPVSRNLELPREE
jgi:sugar O-acyltransferase (sialic acid O-acetyltransferase NeuD family)